MPVSALRSQGAGAPSAASHPGARERRPVASTTIAAGIVLPSASRTPVTVGRPPSRASPTRLSTMTPSPSSIPGRPATLARSAHSKVERRQARSTTSSSSPRGASATPGGVTSSMPSSRTPAARSRSSTSGRWARSTTRSRARKACEWRNCGTPGRSQSANASSGSAVSARRSRSRTTTRGKCRARSRAAPRPASPPPRTTAGSGALAHGVDIHPRRYAIRSPVSPAQRRYLLLEQGVGAAVFNFLLNAAIAWLIFRGADVVPLWGQQSIAGDTIGTSVILPFLTCLIATRLVRGHVRSGKVAPLGWSRDTQPWLGWLPRGTLARGLALGGVGLLVFAPPVLLAHVALGVTQHGLARFVVFKASFAAAEALVVTPLVALWAIVERPAAPAAALRPGPVSSVGRGS